MSASSEVFVVHALKTDLCSVRMHVFARFLCELTFSVPDGD